MKLRHDDRDIWFSNPEINGLGRTDYTPEIWAELSKVNWYMDATKVKDHEKTYIYTGSTRFGKGKDLHQVVMKHWYGYEEYQAAYDKNFIVEHHDNDDFNNLISNLSFASNDLNLTKAHSFDKNQPKLARQAAVSTANENYPESALEFSPLNAR